MEWNQLGGIVVLSALVAVAYQAIKGDGWSQQFNQVAGLVLGFVAGFTGIVDQLPDLAVAGQALGVDMQGTGAEGILTALGGAFAHGRLLKGTLLGKGLKLELLPRLLSLTSLFASGVAAAAKRKEPEPPPSPTVPVQEDPTVVPAEEGSKPA